MKYMQTGGYRGHVLMRLTLACTFVFLTGFWITNVLLYSKNMGLDPTSVVQYYNGADEEFSMPRTYGSMLEVTHMHLSMMAVVLLLLTHLCIFLPWSMRARVALVLVTFGSALAGEGAGWLVRFVHPGFAWLKIGAFLGLQAALAILLIALAFSLVRRTARAADSGLWNGDNAGDEPAEQHARPRVPHTTRG